jgi:HAE1 family hydrophobic/amphiphilic exporter-1
MARFFIHRPIFAIVISVIMVILGGISAYNLPVAQYPQISPPTISVSTTYTGANASVINQTVAQLIEDQVNGTQGMDYMSSTSDDTGSYNLSVKFALGSDGDMDSVKVQNNVQTANASLPSDVQAMGVTTKKSSNDMAYMVCLYSPNDTYDLTFLKNYADIYLLDKIKRIKGVGDVSVFGADYSMRVWVNPDKLAELGLTISDVTAAIKEQNVQAPAGTVGQLPAPKNQEKQYTGEIEGRLTTPEEFGNIVIKTNSHGSFVRVKDVGRVETGAKNNALSSDVDGHVGVGFGVQLTNDANAMETIAAVKKVLEEAKPSFPPDIEYKSVVDNTQYISESIKEVVKTFIEALLLVVVIVFIFLQSWRATVIPLLAVPVSLIGTFITFQFLGFTINTLTLFAMVLAIGLVVDDAIVVIENVEQHMNQEGLTPVDATERAMDEVQGPVVAIACVLAAVFIPVAFLSGMTGVLYKQFALTIAIAMGLSAFIALTLTPALCAMLLKPKQKVSSTGILGRFFQKFNKAFLFLRNRYLEIVGTCIGKAKYAVVFLLIICGLTVVLYKVLPTTFVPDEDQGYFLVSVNLPEGTSLNRTEETMDAFRKDIQSVPGVVSVMKVAGHDSLASSTKSNAGSFFVGLKPWSERKTADLSIQSIVQQINQLGRNHPEASIFAFTTPSLPGLGMVGGWTMELQDMTGHTDQELSDITNKIVAAANQRPQLQGVRTTYKINSPIYKYEIDRDKVKSYGVSLSDVFTAMQVNYGGYQVNDFNQFGRTYKVMLQADTAYRGDTDGLKFIYVKSASGTMIPLDVLLKPKRSTAPSTISRFNATRSVSIQGNTAPGYSSGQAIAAMEEVVAQTAPSGFSVEWSGQSREEKKASSSILQVLGLSLIFVFLCLAALYEKWSVPYAVLLTVPTGIFGAFLTVYGLSWVESLFGIQNSGLQDSVYMQIGIIMIMGLAAKNAILIVEFAKVRVDRGMAPVKAALEAARLRLRPIIMTSLAFIIGCLPLAVATGAGAAARNSMGTAVVGGMLFATSLGIFLIPVFFVVVETISAKLGMLKHFHKKSPKDYM